MARADGASDTTGAGDADDRECNDDGGQLAVVEFVVGIGWEALGIAPSEIEVQGSKMPFIIIVLVHYDVNVVRCC